MVAVTDARAHLAALTTQLQNAITALGRDRTIEGMDHD
jgi:hypothetical protein